MSEPSLDKQPQQPSDHDQVIHYLDKHQQGLTRRLRHWRDEQLSRHALKVAGEPGLVLDLPSGAGRFWPVLAEHSNRVILAADHSPAMLAAAESRYWTICSSASRCCRHRLSPSTCRRMRWTAFSACACSITLLTASSGWPSCANFTVSPATL